MLCCPASIRTSNLRKRPKACPRARKERDQPKSDLWENQSTEIRKSQELNSVLPAVYRRRGRRFSSAALFPCEMDTKWLSSKEQAPATRAFPSCAVSRKRAYPCME